MDGVFGFRKISRRNREPLEMKKGGGGVGTELEERKDNRVGKREGDCSFSGSITSCGRSVLLCCIWG